MKAYEPVMSFDATVAARYDGGLRGDEDATVEFLDRLARGGPTLELAIGTGRIALPLAARGLAVDGVDFSEPMVAELRKKPGGDALAVTIGDFAEVPVSGNYRLIYLIYNTLFNLLTQDDQVRCFQNVARHLMEDGCFVVEGFIPSAFHRLRDDQYVNAEAISMKEVVLDVLRHDPMNQQIEENHVTLAPSGIQMMPVVQRYSWPSELDLMARLAGLRLLSRFGTWDCRELTAQSTNCISVYGW